MGNNHNEGVNNDHNGNKSSLALTQLCYDTESRDFIIVRLADFRLGFLKKHRVHKPVSLPNC